MVVIPERDAVDQRHGSSEQLSGRAQSDPGAALVDLVPTSYSLSSCCDLLDFHRAFQMDLPVIFPLAAFRQRARWSWQESVQW